MSNMALFKPVPVIGGISTTTGTGAANLLTPDPKEVWTAASVGADNIDIDFGYIAKFDCIFLGFTNATTDAYLSIAGGPTYTTAGYAAIQSIRRPEAVGPRYHGLYFRPGVPFEGRYLRLGVVQGSAGPPLQVGIVAAGKTFQPTWNREWGSGRKVIDTSTKQRLRGGGFGIGRGAKVPGYQWTFGDLNDAELQTLYNLLLDRGESDPVIVAEDPDNTAGLAERVHYGLLNRIDAYEREDPDLNRYALSMESWG